MDCVQHNDESGISIFETVVIAAQLRIISCTHEGSGILGINNFQMLYSTISFIYSYNIIQLPGQTTPQIATTQATYQYWFGHTPFPHLKQQL